MKSFHKIRSNAISQIKEIEAAAVITPLLIKSLTLQGH